MKPGYSMFAALLLASIVAAGSAAVPASARSRPGDWTRFGYDAARTNSAPRGIPVSTVGSLQEQLVRLPGTVDSSPIFLAGVRVAGHRRDLLVMTTSYGITLGLDAASGRILWRFTPASYSHLVGTTQITEATPVADSSRRFVFAASPDGRVHKLRVRNGHEVRSGHWPASVTRNAGHEKIASALNLDRRWVLLTTSGYFDVPPYQGKVVAIDRRSGRLDHVWNSLCSQRRRIIVPRTCSASDSAIWSRAGAVVDPRNHHIFVATGNGPFNGRTNWGDSVLELSPGAGRLLRHYTPFGQAGLESDDLDLGSTAPAIVPGSGRRRYLLQGGKDGLMRLLGLRRSLHGVRGRAGRRLGRARQTLPESTSPMVTAPAVRRSRGNTTVFVATWTGTTAYRLRGGRLRRVWHNDSPGTSPVLAGDVLWVFDTRGALNAYRPEDGKLLNRFKAALGGHWNSPIVAGGRVFLPTGNANHPTSEPVLVILAPPAAARRARAFTP